MDYYGRMQWKGKFEFLFTTFGYTIGLGNIWRFPYTCYKNGGGAFFIPYVLMIILCTFPILFLEMVLGQFTSQGPVKIWSICPLFQGIGWANIFILLITNIYYITIIMYALYFMLVAFVNIGGSVPWKHCSTETWSTDRCRDQPFPDLASMASGDIIKFEIGNMDQKCVESVTKKWNMTQDNVNGLPIESFRSYFSECPIDINSPEEEYWNRFVLQVHESDGTHSLGSIVGRNVFLLICVWIIIYYCCLKGIRSISKVIYFTGTVPFGLILILLVRGMTLTGYEKGISYYTQPDWGKLSDLQIWASAATQSIYSIGIAFGSHIALSSHNKFKHNMLRDCIVITIANSLTSILSGFVVFSFLGHAAHRLNTNIEDLFDPGPGILFISYAQGISQLPGAAVWGSLFYLTVFMLGLDSEIVMVWTMTSTMQDSFPRIFKKYERLGLLGICMFLFLLGLPLVTQGGMHMIVLMDSYLANFSLTMFVILESVVVVWIYGINNYINDIEMMIGEKSPKFWLYWKVTWIVCAPGFCLFIFIASIITYGPSSYDGKVINSGGEAIGWLIILTPILIFLVGIVIQIYRYGGLRNAVKPTSNWGPADEDNRYGKYAAPGYMDNVDPYCGIGSDGLSSNHTANDYYLTPTSDSFQENGGFTAEANGGPAIAPHFLDAADPYNRISADIQRSDGQANLQFI